MARVLIVDSLPAFAEGLARALEQAGVTLDDSRRAHSCRDAVSLSSSRAFDLSVVDVTLTDALMLCRRLGQRNPGGSLVLLYDATRPLPDLSSLVHAVEVRACLARQADARTLARHIVAAMEGTTIMPKELARSVLRRAMQRMSPLSDREVQIVDYLARGADIREIATSIYVSECTVKRHISNIVTKLSVRNRTAAVAIAVDAGLVQVARP